MATDHDKNNGARLSRLIIDQGTKTMRMYFDSIHLPANLTSVLYSYYSILKDIRAFNATQMKMLFPPSGVLPAMPAKPSINYDITLLFILLRNICGLTPRLSASGHGHSSWDEKPPLTDTSPEADLARIKYYRNVVYDLVNNTGVKDVDFNTYWSEISDALVRLRADRGDIAKLKTDPLDEDLYISLLNESFEKEYKSEVLQTKTLKKTENIEEIVQTNISGIQCLKTLGLAVIILAFFYFLFSSNHLGEEPDYSYRQNLSSPGFVGRKWVYRMLDNILSTRNVRGVQLLAEPGWGKSAIMKRLIDSSSSSAVIHENIIGFHFCKYNDKSTRDGERFVKNLVQQISKKISEFREIVNKDQSIQDELQSKCKENPMECFLKVIVEPLQKLNGTERNNSFILIDALDECLEKEERHHSMIVNILSSRDGVSELPLWVKLIVTSRKQAQATGKMSEVGLSKIIMNVKDQRNLNDLRTYAEQTLQNCSNGVPSTKEKLHLNDAIDVALKFSKGHFLFLKEIIKFWRKYPDKMNEKSVPEDWGAIYSDSFGKRFKEADLKHFEPFLEVLLAANSPLTLSELIKILNFHDKNVNTRKVAKTLSEYFASDDIDEGPLEFHHQFFAEWLTKQTDGVHGIFITKSRGHQIIVDYLFHFYDKRQTSLTYEELSDLCIHVLHGEKSVLNKSKLSSLNASEVRDSSGRCILHDLAQKRNATELIDGLIKQFHSVDILDNRGWTPAMYAVKEGNYENVYLFINNSANVNHTVKRTVCFILDFMMLRSSYETNSSLSFVAAYRGYEEIARLMVTKGAKIDIPDECGWKPLHVAIVMGHLKIVQLYINNTAQPDTISLHHAAAKNHTKIAEFLLNSGVEDECLPCKPGNMSWCRLNLNRLHHCFCETALHAAVSRDNLEMAKLIIRFGNASVNCKHGSGRTPLMEALLRKNTEMAKLLIRAGANIAAECESSTSNLFHDCSSMANEENEWLYSRYCNEPVCYNGDSVMHLSLAHEVWKVATPFTSKGKLNASESTISATAAIYDQVDFINSTYGNRINSIPNIQTILRYVAVCRSVKTLKHLLDSGDYSKFTIVYEDGKTLLYLAILGSSKRKTEAYVTQSCAGNACVCPDKTRGDMVKEKCLEMVMLLTNVLKLEINKQDKYGRTALHYAAVHKLPEVVKYLVNAGTDSSIKDQRDDTAVEFALRERPLETESFLPCRLTSDQVFRVCQSTLFDEMTSYLLQNATIKKCDTRAENLLRSLLYHKLPLSLYVLLKSGLDVNCGHEEFKRYLNRIRSIHWNRRHDDILEVFKIFQINPVVVCDVPFTQSELHLMAYLGTPSLQVGNLFQPSVNKNSFPLHRFITSGDKGVEILNECYDNEGYLPSHRAVQGINFDALSWFIEIGVDLSKKTKHGLTALVLATHNYPSSLTFYALDYNKKRIFEKLLGKMEEEGHANFKCNNKLIDLSPLHVAGSRGMGMLHTFQRKMPAFPLICTNSDGIQPIYLAYLYHATNPYFSWSDKRAFQELGLSPDTGPSKYPEREAEYHLIYNQFYRTPQEDLRHVLNHDYLPKCPGINELLLNKTCVHSCCFEIMGLLQEKLTSEPLEYKKVGRFVAERMGWTNTTTDGDVKYRWPFNFLLKKALKTDKRYEYLEILSPRF